VKLSIVTVTYRDAPGLARTLNSLCGLLSSSLLETELIIVSGDKKGDLALPDVPQMKMIYGADKGIYDAMNQGMAAASGDFLWFLNGGDECVLSDVSLLVEYMKKNKQKLLFFSYLIAYSSSSVRPRKPKPLWYLIHALPTSHQAIVYPLAITREVSYSPEFKIAGDYDFTLRAMRNAGGVRIPKIFLAKFHADGISSTSHRTLSREALKVQETVLRHNAVFLTISRFVFYVSSVGRKISSWLHT
jgi:putative colanic acid biosynthesis glycosyltransferase